MQSVDQALIAQKLKINASNSLTQNPDLNQLDTQQSQLNTANQATNAALNKITKPVIILQARPKESQVGSLRNKAKQHSQTEDQSSVLSPVSS